ncbi:MAG: hypothetical protein R3B67_02455 [Phycisphaerales bacterium]
MGYGELFFTLLPFVPASMLVLFGVVLVQVLYRALFVPPGFDRKQDGHCAACGYVLGALEDQRCPECGVDLLRAGILTRRMFIQLRGSSVGAISCWTVLILLLAAWRWRSGGRCAVAVLDVQRDGRGMSGYTQISKYGPESSWNAETREMEGETFGIEFEITANTSGVGLAKPLGVVLRLPDDRAWRMTVEEDGSWELRDDKDKRLEQGDELDAAVIDKLFVAAGFDVQSDEFRSYSAQVFVLAEAGKEDGVNGLQSVGFSKMNKVQEAMGHEYTLTQQGWTNTGTTFTGGMMAPGGIPYAMWSPVLYGFIGLVLVYVLGVIYILRRRRKVLSIGNYTSVHLAE